MYRLDYPWLLALLPLPLLIWWLWPPYREDQESVRVPFFEGMTRMAGLQPSPGSVVLKSNWFQRMGAALCWALLVLAAARPEFVEPPIQRIESGRDMLLALDISQSMEAADYRAPNGKLIPRVDAVKQVVADFIRKRTGDRIGIILFGAAAYPQAPLTLDHEACLALLDQTEAGMAGPRTMIGDAIGLAIKLFDSSKAKERVLILLTDGNDTGSRMPPGKAADIAKSKGVLIHTISIGDPSATGEDRVDLKAMRDIASRTGGRMFEGQDQGQLEQVYATIDKITPQNFKTLSYRPHRPLFLYPLAAATTILLAYHFVMFVWTTLRGLIRPVGDAA